MFDANISDKDIHKSRDMRCDLEPFQSTTLTKKALDHRPNKQKDFKYVSTLL